MGSPADSATAEVYDKFKPDGESIVPTGLLFGRFAAAKSEVVIGVGRCLQTLDMPTRIELAMVGVGLAAPRLLFLVVSPRHIDVEKRTPFELRDGVPVLGSRHHLCDVSVEIIHPKS